MRSRVERLEKLMFSLCYQRKADRKSFSACSTKLEERENRKMWEEEVAADSSCHFHKLRNDGTLEMSPKTQLREKRKNEHKRSPFASSI